MVRIAGLEPARITPLPPQSSASANSAICATGGGIKQHRPNAASRFWGYWKRCPAKGRRRRRGGELKGSRGEQGFVGNQTLTRRLCCGFIKQAAWKRF